MATVQRFGRLDEPVSDVLKVRFVELLASCQKTVQALPGTLRAGFLERPVNKRVSLAGVDLGQLVLVLGADEEVTPAWANSGLCGTAENRCREQINP